MLFIRRYFDLPPLNDIVAAVASNSHIKRPTALVTFDDGYRDNYELAFPILKSCKVPAVFFVPTDFVDRPSLPWWDRIAFVVKQSRTDIIEMKFPEQIAFDLRTTPRKHVVKKILDLYKQHRGRDERKFISHLEEQAKISPPPHVLAHRWIITWDEIRNMISAGMSIGSHTHTHGILGGMDEATQARELRESKTILERETGQPITTLAYPVGSTTAFNEITKRLAKEIGYSLAFSYYGGVNWPEHTDPFDIRRIGVEANESMSLFRTKTVFNSLFGKAF